MEDAPAAMIAEGPAPATWRVLSLRLRSGRRARRLGREPRPVPSARRPARGGRIDPFRVAADAPAPSTPAATAPPARRRAPAAPAGLSERRRLRREEHLRGGRCQPIETRTNVLFLYYRKGPSPRSSRLLEQEGTAGLHGPVPLLLALLGAEVGDDRDRPGPPGLLVQGARLLVIRGLAVRLRVQQVRLGGSPARHVQGRRSRRHSGFGAVLFLYWWKRAPSIGSTWRSRCSLRRGGPTQLHLGAAAELLLAHGQCPQPAGAAALLRGLARRRRHLRHLARLPPP